MPAVKGSGGESVTASVAPQWSEKEVSLTFTPIYREKCISFLNLIKVLFFSFPSLMKRMFQKHCEYFICSKNQLMYRVRFLFNLKLLCLNIFGLQANFCYELE